MRWDKVTSDPMRVSSEGPPRVPWEKWDMKGLLKARTTF